MSVNRFAGMGSHQSARSKTYTWLTPIALIEAIGGPESFDLDPCAAVGQPWATARQHFTIVDNGLIQEWSGRIWLNPPYSMVLARRFLARMAGHNHGVALTFARTETEAFHRFVWPVASGVLFLAGRVHFHLPDGTRAAKNGGAPSVLIAYGDEDCEILASAPIDGSFVPLRVRVSVILALGHGSWAEELAQWFAGRAEPVPLAEIYRAFVGHPKAAGNQYWRDKLRQTLQRGAYERVTKGVWRRAA